MSYLIINSVSAGMLGLQEGQFVREGLQFLHVCAADALEGL